MADYRCSVKPRLSRSKGASVARAASYIARERLEDERTGEVYDFSGHKDKALWAGIYAPKNAPEWAHDLQILTNEIERAEKRKDSQLALPIELSLAHELTLEQNRWMLQDFIKENCTRPGYATIAAIHEPPHGGDPRNIHAHLLVTLRTMDESGFSKTKKEQQDNYMARSERVEALRASWEKHLKHHLERHGFAKEAAEVSCKSLKERGIDREPQKHLGPTASDMERKGKTTERGKLNREIKAHYSQYGKLKTEHAALTAEIAALEREERRAKEQGQTPVLQASPDVLQKTEHGQQAKSAKDFQKHQEAARRERQTEQLENAQNGPEKTAQAAVNADLADGLECGVDKAGKVGGRLADGFMNSVDRCLDFFVGAPPSRQEYTPAQLARDPALRREVNRREIAEREAAQNRSAALDKWEEQLRQSNNNYSQLPAEDLKFLSRDDLMGLKTHGADHIRTMIEEHEQEKRSLSVQGKERERERS